MTKFALIKNNKVDNIIEADQQFINSIELNYDNCIDITNDILVHRGDLYISANNTFISDIIEDTPIKYCTVLQFRSKFTTEEKVAIYTAANSNVLIKIWLDDLNVVQNNIVNLDDPRTIASVQFLESSGLIGTGRANTILEI